MAKRNITLKSGVDVYQVYLSAVLLLRSEGFEGQSYELLRRGQDSLTTHELQKIVLEYVDVYFD